jgi:hypothetical protein
MSFLAWTPPAYLPIDPDPSDTLLQSNQVDRQLHATSALPNPLGHCLSRNQKLEAVLAYFREICLAPVDLMIYALNVQSPKLEKYQIGLYKTDGKLLEMMDTIMGDLRGAETLRKWMQPHAIEATCALVD